MHEGVELLEGHEGHDDNRFVVPVSVTISILAVLVAVVTLLGHRAHTEELLLQSQATDQWAYYQAKNIRLHEMQTMIDLLNVVTTLDREKTEEHERERDLLSAKADRFDAGEGILEIALVICSLTLLTDKKFFWYTAMLIGAVGIAASLGGFLHH